MLAEFKKPVHKEPNELLELNRVSSQTRKDIIHWNSWVDKDLIFTGKVNVLEEIKHSNIKTKCHKQKNDIVLPKLEFVASFE